MKYTLNNVQILEADWNAINAFAERFGLKSGEAVVTLLRMGINSVGTTPPPPNTDEPDYGVTPKKEQP